MSLLQDTKTESIDVINKRLIERFGSSLENYPKFRIVWSGDQYEKRFGHYEEFCGNIFLRTFVGVKETEKYEYIKPAKFVLEELTYADNPDLPLSRVHYEPKWTFMDKDRNPLWPKWDIIEIVIKSRLDGIRKTLSDYIDEDEKKFKQEVMDFEATLGDPGVHDMKNQTCSYVKPVFLGGLNG